LPTDLARPPRQSFRGATEHRILQSDLWERLNALGRQEKANSLMMLLAASQVLLMRYSGQEDFGIGTVVANRKRKETRGLIGFFLNTLVIRANLRGEPSFREVLRRVREAVLSGYEYQDLSFEKLVEELAPDRDLSRSPLFQVAFILRRAFEGESEFGGLELVPFELDPGTSKFDLIVSVEERKQSAIIALNYTTDLFEAETIRGMLEQYERLLEGIVADVDQPIWSLPMMRKSEEEALSAWNFAGRVAHAGQNIVEIFDAQAENRPEEPAAVFGETRLSWAELGRRASQLAQYLVHQGVAPESQVGIFMHESPEMMVAILGVLKAGGAYVLLDVLDPKDRLRSIVDRSGIAVLLAMENLRRRLPQTHAQVVCLDSEQEAIGRQSATNPSVQINPQGLACVIYTAASEKHFKGWMVEHSGLLCLVATPGIADSTHQNGHAPGNRLPEICSRLTSSSFLAGTSAFLTSVAEGERTKFRSSGNAEIYLLDPHLRRVAIGIPGELWISGPAAGRGYLGRPSLTAEKFLPNPFTSGMGARMRRSGVKARYRRDGTIEFLGRLDDQVEIGGFQMELGEIEAALTNHEIVREAVAVVRPNGELVAYVVLDDGKRMGQNDLGDYLYERLPSYMIPGAFITLQELPRTAGGEVDRAALAVLGQEQLNKETVLPRTELERTIAAAWQSVLAVDQVGVHDNFFDLGGHSLLMIQLHQKLRRELPVEIELLHLFQFPTIDSLGRFLHTGYNFDEKSRETQDRAGKQKSAHQKFKRIHTP
jgi:non-ribosomal peptide synthetase component F/aryl carrier-like protein